MGKKSLAAETNCGQLRDVDSGGIKKNLARVEKYLVRETILSASAENGEGMLARSFV